jgi:paraquat-inducible protein B
MSKQASKSLIGAFVIGAIVLAVIGILIFGSGKFFAEKTQYVLYFKGSVKGLSIGAPVVFRGVKIGTVTDIQLHFDAKDLSIRIPVIIEIEREKFKQVRDREVERDQHIQPLIDRGLRAQLTMQSMVTGQLMVNIDFFPETPIVLTGVESEHTEIPTISSGFEELLETIEDLPLQVLFDKLVSSVEGIETLVKAPETRESINSLNEALKSAKKTLDDIDMQIQPLMTNIEETSDAARAAFVQAEKTLAMEEGVPGDLAASLKKTLDTASTALEETEKTISSIQESVAEDSALSYEMSTMLKDLSAAARSIRVLADYFERHPEALIKGKGAGIRR